MQYQKAIKRAAAECVQRMLSDASVQQLWTEDNYLLKPKILSNIINNKPIKLNENRVPDLDSFLDQLQQYGSWSDATYIENNCSLIVNALEFSDYEAASKILFAIVLLSKMPELDTLIHSLIEDDRESNYLIGLVFDLNEEAVEQTVVELTSTPLFERHSQSFLGATSLNISILHSLINEPADSYFDLLHDTVKTMPSTSLTLDDFEYVGQRHLAADILKVGSTESVTGMSILLYGDVGTGKTSLAMSLAAEANCELFCIHAQGNKLSHEQTHVTSNVNSGKLTHQYLSLVSELFKSNQGVALYVTEAETLLNQSLSRLEGSKSDIHSLLENTPLVILLSVNDISEIEPSILRRFSLILPVHTPPETHLKRIMDSELQGLRIREKTKQKLLKLEGLKPSHIVNSAEVMKLVGYKGKQAETEILTSVEASLEALGYTQSENSYRMETPFSEKYINVDGFRTIYPKLCDAIGKGLAPRIGLFGYSGTGKTAFANHVADTLDMKLITISGADVLSKWVGEAEKNVKEIFSQANETVGCILFLDEADSLLFNRASTERQHEVSLINTLLVEIQSCKRCLMLASNFQSRLDTALSRRIDFKLDFKYLNKAQVIELFKETLQLAELTKFDINELNKLDCVTVSDFTLYKRRVAVTGERKDSVELIRFIAAESSRRSNKPIGFIN